MKALLNPIRQAWVVFLIMTSVAAGQTTSAGLVGSVRDGTNAVLPGVTLTVKNQGTGATRVVVTNGSGEYSVRELPPGDYEVQAELAGFRTVVRSGIRLTVGREALLDIEMQLGDVSEKVVVSGEAALVDTASATIRGLVDDRQIRDLPLNGRSFDQLALLQPGVVAFYGAVSAAGSISSAGTGQRFSVGGGRPTSNNFLLDGTNINNTAGATPGSVAGVNLGVEAIREFEILTSVYDATFGRNSGAVINVVSKSGTNAFHGSVFEFHRNSALDAPNFFDPGQEPPPFKRNQFGFALGGPVKRDTAFFFANYEGFRERLGVSSVAIVPTAAARQGILPSGNVTVNPAVRPYLDLYPLPNGRDFGDGLAEFISSPSRPIDEDYITIRYDHQLSQADPFFVRYTVDDASKVLVDPIGVFPGLHRTKNHYVTAEHKRIFSSTMLNTARFGFNRSVSESDVQPDAAANVPASLSFVPGEFFGSINFAATPTAISPGMTNLVTPATVNFYWTSFQFANDFSYSTGSNSLHIGANIERVHNELFAATSFRGAYSFDSLPLFLEGRARQFQSNLPDSQLGRRLRTTLIALYVQDNFRWRPNVTLNAGLRYEGMTTLQEADGLQSQLVNTLDPNVVIGLPYFNRPDAVFQPRVGVAWDLSGNGKTSLRAGVGIYSDTLVGLFTTSAANQALPFSALGTVSNPAPSTFPRAYDLVRQGLPSITRTDPDPDLPRRAQFNLSVQQELSGMVLTVAYTGAVGRHGIRSAEANTAIPAIVDGEKFWAAGLPRRNPNFGSILTAMTDVNSTYNGLQLSIARRFSRGLDFQGSYTWGHSIDDGSQQFGSEGSSSPQNHTDLENRIADRGDSIFDVTHNFTFNGTYDLPFGRGRRFGDDWGAAANHVFGGWQINSILTLASGTPVTLITSFNRSRNLDSRQPDRPDLVPGRSDNPVLGGPDRYFDPTAFALPPAGFQGDLGRTTLRGPGLAVLDLGLVKTVAVSDKVNVQVRSEVFNLLNRANFGNPANAIFNPDGTIRGNAGRISSTVTTSRQIQFALKVTF